MAVTGGLSRDGDQEAGVAFVTFLRSSGLPQNLWETLLERISNGSLGTDGQIEVQCSPLLQCDSTKAGGCTQGTSIMVVTGRLRKVLLC